MLIIFLKNQFMVSLIFLCFVLITFTYIIMVTQMMNTWRSKTNETWSDLKRLEFYHCIYVGWGEFHHLATTCKTVCWQKTNTQKQADLQKRKSESWYILWVSTELSLQSPCLLLLLLFFFFFFVIWVNKFFLIRAFWFGVYRCACVCVIHNLNNPNW